LIAMNHTSYVDWLPASLAAVRRGRRLLVGLHPEATISRSFELRQFKTGAARLAHEAEVPIIPLIVWGAQGIWTKDHPKSLGHNKIPITVKIGAAIYAGDSPERMQAALRASVNALLHEAQETYPHPAGAYWVPHRLGAGAPSPDEAKALGGRAQPAGKPAGGPRQTGT
jgi:1-acyl-sn-glycerol-3-phosphate acyltransferase